MAFVSIPVIPKEPDKPNNPISITRTQYALVNPENGHIHAQGTLPVVSRVWEMERKEFGNDLNLEVRETQLIEIKTMTAEDIHTILQKRVWR